MLQISEAMKLIFKQDLTSWKWLCMFCTKGCSTIMQTEQNCFANRHEPKPHFMSGRSKIFQTFPTGCGSLPHVLLEICEYQRHPSANQKNSKVARLSSTKQNYAVIFLRKMFWLFMCMAPNIFFLKPPPSQNFMIFSKKTKLTELPTGCLNGNICKPKHSNQQIW